MREIHLSVNGINPKALPELPYDWQCMYTYTSNKVLYLFIGPIDKHGRISPKRTYAFIREKDATGKYIHPINLCKEIVKKITRIDKQTKGLSLDNVLPREVLIKEFSSE